MAVAHLARDPARIGGAGAQHARDLLLQGARAQPPRPRRVKMRYESPRRPARDCGGETAFVLGEGVGVEHVLPGHVLHMNEGVGAARRAPRNPRAPACPRPRRRRHGWSRRDRPRRARRARSSRPAQSAPQARRHRRPAPRRKCARTARASHRASGLSVRVFVQRARRACTAAWNRRDLARKDVAEQAGNAQRHVDARPAELRQRQDLEAADAGRGGVPESAGTPISARPCARSSPPVRIVALPHRSSTMRARPFAMVLRVARQHLLGGAPADLPGGAGRMARGSTAIEIAAGRQHVEAAARRRAGRVRARRSGRRAPRSDALHISRFAHEAPRIGIIASSARWPNTCSPSPMRISLRSQSQASSATSASSESRSRVTPHSSAQPGRARRAPG